MKTCKIDEIDASGYNKGKIEYKSNVDWMMKKNLFFDSDFYVKKLIKLGISVNISNNINLNYNTDSYYHYTELGKVLMKIGDLKLTEEFLKVVDEALKSSNPKKKLKRITEEFGQFIPSEFILGERAYFEGIGYSEGQVIEGDIFAGFRAVIRARLGCNERWKIF